MKKYILAGGIGVVGIIVGIATKMNGIGMLITLLLIAVALIVAFAKIQFIDNLFEGNKKARAANPAEAAVNDAIDFLNEGKTMDAVNKLEEAAELVETSAQYVYYGCEALRILATLYETGKYGNSTVQISGDKAVGYYERLLKLEPSGDVYAKVARDLLSKNNYSKALSYYEKAADLKDHSALLKLGSIYEEGLYKYDAFGNRGDTIIEINLEKAKTYYERLAALDDEQGIAALDRVEYALNNTDSIEFEEKEKLYQKISERRKSQGVELRFKTIEGSKLQYQYTYIHDEAEGYIHKLPKDWVKVVDEEDDSEYYAPNEDYQDLDRKSVV